MSKNDLVEQMFLLWDTELMSVWVQLRVVLARGQRSPQGLSAVWGTWRSLGHPSALCRTVLLVCLLRKSGPGPSVLWSSQNQHWQNFRESWLTWEGADDRTLLNCRHFIWVANLERLLSLIKEGFSPKAPYLITLGILVIRTLPVLSTQGA